jgi:hypothetical protein
VDHSHLDLFYDTRVLRNWSKAPITLPQSEVGYRVAELMEDDRQLNLDDPEDRFLVQEAMDDAGDQFKDPLYALEIAAIVWAADEKFAHNSCLPENWWHCRQPQKYPHEFPYWGEPDDLPF